MITRAVIVPRLGAGPDSDFYPWLDEQLRQSLKVTRHAFLRPDAPRLGEWVPVVLSQLWQDPEEVLIVAHGLGSQAALHALSRLRAGLSVGGLLCVEARWTPDAPGAEWQRPVPALHRGRQAVEGRCRVMLAADADPADAARWQTMLGAQVEAHPGAEHLSEAVLAAIGEMRRRSG